MTACTHPYETRTENREASAGLGRTKTGRARCNTRPDCRKYGAKETRTPDPTTRDHETRPFGEACRSTPTLEYQHGARQAVQLADLRRLASEQLHCGGHDERCVPVLCGQPSPPLLSTHLIRIIGLVEVDARVVFQHHPLFLGIQCTAIHPPRSAR